MITTMMPQKDLKTLYNHIKGSAKKRGINFSLTMSDLNDLGFPLTCPILDIPLVWNRGRAKDNSYSLDRIDSKGGYEAGNIVVVSMRANRLKSDATLEEMRRLVEYYDVFG